MSADPCKAAVTATECQSIQSVLRFSRQCLNSAYLCHTESVHSDCIRSNRSTIFRAHFPHPTNTFSIHPLHAFSSSPPSQYDLLVMMSPPSSAPTPPPTPSPRSPAHSPRHSETTQVPRRPRSPPRPHPCRCDQPLLPTSTTTTITTNSGKSKSTRHSPGPAPNYTPAVSFAATTAPTLDVTGAAGACHNATTLSGVLADVVAALDDDSRTFWCQMMDTLALRTAAGDVQYSVAIAPYLPWLAEQAYATHHRALRFQPQNLCCRCAGFRPPVPPTSPVTNPPNCPNDEESLEFSWVDEEEDEDEDDIGNTQRLPVPSFESYICDVLDEHGKNEFVRERYYGGAPLNSRYLLAKFGTNLGMSPEEAQLRAADLLQDEEHIPFSDEEYMSGVSDVESQDRSDNGV